ncbi:hypothetical protein HDU93_001174 [Gonapodya sp. JEL0774]|nr:hypothetical protein HDU93_001174 [Gonapodya sp. JEL0774]
MSLVKAVPAQLARTPEEARLNALRLYRQWLRATPDIIDFHWLDMPASQFRQRIRLEFERNRHLRDVGQINRAIFKSQKDLEEMLNHWQQKSHVMRIFEADTQAMEEKMNRKTFLQKFYEGKDF